jgi:hypothetical protein
MKIVSCWLVVVSCLSVGCATTSHHPTTAPTTQESRSVPGSNVAAIDRGVKFLIDNQQPDGSWGTGTVTRGLEIYSMVPGSLDSFRVATTALCVMALREVGETTCHDKGVEYLVTHGEAKRDSGALLYNTWAHTYALQALAIEMRYNKDPRIEAMAKWHLDRMVRYATYLGGWNYYDFEAHTQQPSLGPTSFGTAAGLVALWDARKSGLDVPQNLIDSSLRRLDECRLPMGTYMYGSDYKYTPRLPANQIKGAVGRTQPSNYALWLWDWPKISPPQVQDGLELFFSEHEWLDFGRKRPYPHESWYQTSGYYYYFDHYYAALLIERLPPEQRKDYATKLVAHVLPHQELDDGSWWDYAMWDFHKPYGTAFAVMTLLHCDKMMQQPGQTVTAATNF